MKSSPHALGLMLITLALTHAAMAGPKVPGNSGPWEKISWLGSANTGTSAPKDGDDLYIANNQAVTVTPGDRSVRYLRIGTNGGGYDWLTATNGSGALLVNDGTLSITGERFQLGTLEGTKAVLSLKGGTVQQSAELEKGRLETGVAPNTTNIIEIHAGKLSVNSMLLSRANGSSTALKITGGALELTGVRGNTYLASPLGGKTTAFFEQSGGSVTVKNNLVFFIGSGAKEGDELLASARIVGGSFAGRIGVGNALGAGNATLVVGPEAKISLEKGGGTVGLYVMKSGRLVFELGATPAFNPIDLKKGTKTVISFDQPGATILVDGTKLASGKNLEPITLITFRKGSGPTKEHVANLRVGYTGFAQEYRPALVWTDTSLQLQLYGARR